MSRDHALTQRLEALEAAALETEGRLRVLEGRVGGGEGSREAERPCHEYPCKKHPQHACFCGAAAPAHSGLRCECVGTHEWHKYSMLYDPTKNAMRYDLGRLPKAERFPAFEEDSTLPDSEDVARDATPWLGPYGRSIVEDALDGYDRMDCGCVPLP